MSGFSYQEMQRAVYQLLSSDVVLSGLVNGVYDHVPSDTSFPYIAIGDADCRDWSTKTSSGIQMLFTIHAYSIEGGRSQAAGIMKRVHELLHQGNLSLSGHALVAIRFEFCNIDREDDGRVSHGRIRFRMYVEALEPA